MRELEYVYFITPNEEMDHQMAAKTIRWKIERELYDVWIDQGAQLMDNPVDLLRPPFPFL